MNSQAQAVPASLANKREWSGRDVARYFGTTFDKFPPGLDGLTTFPKPIRQFGTERRRRYWCPTAVAAWAVAYPHLKPRPHTRRATRLSGEG